MRPVSLQQPISKRPEDFEKWVKECFAELERASHEDVSVVVKDFTVSNHTPTRTLDAGTAVLADVTDVLCTLIKDMQNRGMKRNQ